MRTSNLKRRIGKLDGVWTDSSGLLPNSTEWVEYWYRHFMLDDLTSRRPDRNGGDIVEILRAVLNYDGPLSAAGSKSDQ